LNLNEIENIIGIVENAIGIVENIIGIVENIIGIIENVGRPLVGLQGSTIKNLHFR